MPKRNELPTTLEEIKSFSSQLFADIEKSPTSYCADTNPLIKPIHKAWELNQQGEINDPDLREALTSPRNFVKKLAPQDSKHDPEKLAKGVGLRVGVFLQTEENTYGVRDRYKKGRFVQNNKDLPEGEWQVTQDDDWKSTYVRREVLEEMNHTDSSDIYHSGFHVTTSAVLPEVEKHKALKSSQRLKNEGEQLKNGEVLGGPWTHKNVFVDPDKIQDGYGTPMWFGEHGVTFGIDLDKQRKFLEPKGQRILGSSS